MEAEVRVTVIDVNITHSSSDPSRARAVEVIHQIKTGATVLTRGGATLIYLCTTVLSCVTSNTHTWEGTMVVLNNTNKTNNCYSNILPSQLLSHVDFNFHCNGLAGFTVDCIAIDYQDCWRVIQVSHSHYYCCVGTTTVIYFFQLTGYYPLAIAAKLIMLYTPIWHYFSI